MKAWFNVKEVETKVVRDVGGRGRINLTGDWINRKVKVIWEGEE